MMSQVTRANYLKLVLSLYAHMLNDEKLIDSNPSCYVSGILTIHTTIQTNGTI